MTPYLAGLDLGQTHDPSALVIAQQRLEEWGAVRQKTYQVRYLTRFALGTPYPELVRQTKALLEALPLPDDSAAGRYPAGRGTPGLPFPQPPLFTLVIDATGVGRPVADMFRARTVWPIMVTLTHGVQITEYADRREEYSVPKRAVIGATQVALQTQRLKVARGLPEAETLVREAQNFQYTLTPHTGDDQYGAWRDGAQDDLLLALAVAIWYGEHTAPPQRVTPVQTHATATGDVLGGRRR